VEGTLLLIAHDATTNAGDAFDALYRARRIYSDTIWPMLSIVEKSHGEKLGEHMRELRACAMVPRNRQSTLNKFFMTFVQRKSGQG